MTVTVAIPASVHDANKAALAPLRAALYDFDEAVARTALAAVLAPQAPVRLAPSIGELRGPDGLWTGALAPLTAAIPDLERRDTIVMAGADEHGHDWVGCAGHYCGIFAHPWLDIPPTRQPVALRFHEFFRFEQGRVAEVQALWDIAGLMMQAGAWPMAPSLGHEGLVPAPATQDGLVPGPHDAAGSTATRDRIVAMLAALKRHPAEGGPELMEMERYWHPRMNWYGPAGIGTARGISGFRDWHQIPFLAAMPDRGRYVGEVTYHFFGDGDYAAVTGWPNMLQTLSHGGWLGLIRENWVLVDLLDVYAKVGVDPLARMREFNKARAGFDPETGRALP